jgi:polyketide biosynthesis acyl carrier protein
MKTKVTESEIFAALAQAICIQVPELRCHSFLRTDSLRELGANSLDRAEIVVQVLMQLKLSTPMSTFAPAQNLGELCGLLYERMQQQ